MKYFYFVLFFLFAIEGYSAADDRAAAPSPTFTSEQIEAAKAALDVLEKAFEELMCFMDSERNEISTDLLVEEEVKRLEAAKILENQGYTQLSRAGATDAPLGPRGNPWFTMDGFREACAQILREMGHEEAAEDSGAAAAAEDGALDLSPPEVLTREEGAES